MTYDTIQKMFNKAEKQKYAIGHFNFSTMELLHAILKAGKKMKSPIIVATSEGERKFVGTEEASVVVDALKDRLKGQFILHADHHHTYEAVKEAIQAGYPSVHIDASKNDFDKNVQITKKVVNYAHKKGVWVEGELGYVGGSSTLHEEDVSEASKPEMMTSPEEAKEYAEKTGIDSLAVNIGNAHGVWKGTPKLDFDRLTKIKKVTGKPLVLHGGSGISTQSFKKAIKIGIDKININSDMRIAYAKAIEKAMKERGDFTPYKYMMGPIDAVEKVVEKNIKIFGSDGKL